MRASLARPLGRLFRADDIAGRRFRKAVESPGLVATVGDRVTETVWQTGRVPDLQVVDGKENRVKRNPPDVPYERIVRVANPAGTITNEAIEAVKDALAGKKPVRVLVEGEEDLLVIPVVVMAPESAAVFYGQPGTGIVEIVVDAAAKRRNVELLSRMGGPGEG